MWLQWLMKALVMLPSVIQGIETLHGNAKSGAEKKDLAMQALGLASGVAGAVAPGQQQAIDAATTLASSAIDNTVALLKATGHMTAQPVTTIPAIAPPVVVK